MHRIYWLRILLWGLTILFFAWTISLHAMADHETVWNFLYNGVYGLPYLVGGCSGLVFPRYIRVNSAVKKFFFFSGSAMLSYAIAQGIWTWYNVVLHTPIPESPSFPDFFYLFFYFPMVAGLLPLVGLYLPIMTRRLVLETSVIVVVTSVMTMSVWHLPSFSTGEPVLAVIVKLLYPLGDMLLMTMTLLLLRVGGGKIHKGILVVLLGLVSLTIGDFLFVYRSDTDVYWNGDIVDIFLGCAGVLFAFGMVDIAQEFLADLGGYRSGNQV